MKVQWTRNFDDFSKRTCSTALTLVMCRECRTSLDTCSSTWSRTLRSNALPTCSTLLSFLLCLKWTPQWWLHATSCCRFNKWKGGGTFVFVKTTSVYVQILMQCTLICSPLLFFVVCVCVWVWVCAWGRGGQRKFKIKAKIKKSFSFFVIIIIYYWCTYVRKAASARVANTLNRSGVIMSPLPRASGQTRPRSRGGTPSR